MECVKAKAESIGIENFEGQNLDDLKDWTEIVKNIVKFDKDYKIPIDFAPGHPNSKAWAVFTPKFEQKYIINL